MRYFIAALVLMSTCNLALADHVNGYMKSNGTYVQGYERSAPNGTVQDNYSYRGNTNPYTGQQGTNRYTHDTTSSYYQGPNAQGQSGHDSASENNSAGDSYSH